MNKLDEILQNYRKEIVRTEFIPIDERIDSDVENAYREQLKRQQNEEAKQAIIELIEGEIIGSKLNTTASWSDFDKKHRTMTLLEVGFEEGFNQALDEVSKKLQKLKE